MLDSWIQHNGPDGISRLAVESKVSADTIKRSRASGVAPKKLSTCLSISSAMGVEVDALFPPAQSAEEEAS